MPALSLSHFETSHFRTCRIETTRRLPTTLLTMARKGQRKGECGEGSYIWRPDGRTSDNFICGSGGSRDLQLYRQAAASTVLPACAMPRRISSTMQVMPARNMPSPITIIILQPGGRSLCPSPRRHGPPSDDGWRVAPNDAHIRFYRDERVVYVPAALIRSLIRRPIMRRRPLIIPPPGVSTG